MQVLYSVKKSLIILGILPMKEQNLPVKLRKYQSIINWAHIFFIIVWLTCYFSSVLGFLFLRATTFGQYSEGGLFCSVTAVRVALYIIFVVQKSKLASLMDDLEKIIEKRESSINVMK